MKSSGIFSGRLDDIESFILNNNLNNICIITKASACKEEGKIVYCIEWQIED